MMAKQDVQRSPGTAARRREGSAHPAAGQGAPPGDEGAALPVRLPVHAGLSRARALKKVNNFVAKHNKLACSPRRRAACRARTIIPAPMPSVQQQHEQQQQQQLLQRLVGERSRRAAQALRRVQVHGPISGYRVCARWVSGPGGCRVYRG